MARKIASKEVDLDAGTVKFKFTHGEDLVVDLKSLPKEMQKRAQAHGIAQKIGDAYSGAESSEDALKAAVSALESIMAGDWNVGRAAGEGAAPKVGQLVKALARATGKTEDEASTAIEKLGDEERKALRAHPQVKLALAEIRAEDAKAKAKKAAAADDAMDLGALMG